MAIHSSNSLEMSLLASAFSSALPHAICGQPTGRECATQLYCLFLYYSIVLLCIVNLLFIETVKFLLAVAIAITSDFRCYSLFAIPLPQKMVISLSTEIRNWRNSAGSSFRSRQSSSLYKKKRKGAVMNTLCSVSWRISRRNVVRRSTATRARAAI